MFCPKCGDVELETVTNDKLEYLACVSGCEGVWVPQADLERYWGKKNFKQQESELEEAQQPDFDKEAVVVEKDDLNIDETIDKKKDDELFLEDDLDDDFDEDFDEDDEDDYDEEDDYEDTEDFDEIEEIDEKEEEEEEDEDIEEVSFGDQRALSRTYVEEGEFDEVSEATDGFTSDTTELIEEEEDELMPAEEEETLFLTSPISGNPMKRFFSKVKDKIKCFVAKCTESNCYWIDSSDEVMAIVADRHPPKTFAELLAYERPEEEVFEDEDEDEDDEDI